MNDAPNTTHWDIGDEVIHDADRKCDRMLMVVIGYTRDGRFKTRYKDQSVSRRVYVNEIASLHDPARADIRLRWRED